jgi:hypothetical protein
MRRASKSQQPWQSCGGSPHFDQEGLASGDKAPERDQQLACQSDDHCLARAQTAIRSAGPVPPCQGALLLKQQRGGSAR